MKFERVLKLGDRGEAVKRAKDRLFRKGYYSEKITKITHDRFGSDTKKAVEEFQKANNNEQHLCQNV